MINPERYTGTESKLIEAIACNGYCFLLAAYPTGLESFVKSSASLLAFHVSRIAQQPDEQTLTLAYLRKKLNEIMHKPSRYTSHNSALPIRNNLTINNMK